MSQIRVILTAAACVLGFSVPVLAQNAPDTHKFHRPTMEEGPNWEDVDLEGVLCREGANQSPVDITEFVQEDLPPLQPSYKETPLIVENNGHTIQVNYTRGSALEVGGKTYQLKHIDFHTPSEHTMDGVPAPMELHLIHQAFDGEIAIIAVMLKPGAQNPIIEGIWANAPLRTGERKSVELVKFSAAGLLPESLEYYTYDGSLTVEPCTEGVRWFILKSPVEISEAQVNAFQKFFPMNARPVQPLGGRMIKGN